MTSDKVWVNGFGNLILLKTATLNCNKLQIVPDQLKQSYGIHTVDTCNELIYIDRNSNTKKISNDFFTSDISLNMTDLEWKPQCVYCAKSSGDLLVGMYRWDTDTGSIMRFGRHTQTIQHNKTLRYLFRHPIYLIKNYNGDVVVSDLGREAIVVTSREGRYRFTYTGPVLSGSELKPRAICTDVLSHILVCDEHTHTVHILDKNGQFLKYLLTEQSPSIYCLSYDSLTHRLWVGLKSESTSVAPDVSLLECELAEHRHINRNFS